MARQIAVTGAGPADTMPSASCRGPAASCARSARVRAPTSPAARATTAASIRSAKESTSAASYDDPSSRRVSSTASISVRSSGSSATTRPQRYWPVLDTVSMDRPGSVPCLPVMSVRMNTIRSPFLPAIWAQSSGLVVFGRSSFSLNSSTHACIR